MNNSDKIIKAIRAIDPDSEMTIVGEDIDTCTITWLEDTSPISKSDIKTKITVIEEEEAVKQARILGYGDIGNQLDLLYKDMAADKGDKTGEWFKAVKKVKDDNPKG